MKAQGKGLGFEYTDRHLATVYHNYVENPKLYTELPRKDMEGTNTVSALTRTLLFPPPRWLMTIECLGKGEAAGETKSQYKREGPSCHLPLGPTS